MVNFSYVVTDEVGIHGRPAGVLVKNVADTKVKLLLLATAKVQMLKEL